MKNTPISTGNRGTSIKWSLREPNDWVVNNRQATCYRYSAISILHRNKLVSVFKAICVYYFIGCSFVSYFTLQFAYHFVFFVSFSVSLSSVISDVSVAKHTALYIQDYEREHEHEHEYAHLQNRFIIVNESKHNQINFQFYDLKLVIFGCSQFATTDINHYHE